MRIEDTDRARYVEGAAENLIKTLKAVGLSWDEGPFMNMEHGTWNMEQKGEFGPYIQSQRIGTYRNLAQKLVDNGRAYYCFCPQERLKKLRREQLEKKMPPMYDGRCRELTEKKIEEKIRQGIPYVIRLKVPRDFIPHHSKKGEGPKTTLGFTTPEGIVFKDLIRGEIKFNYQNIDDQILLKSDSWPTYHLANVIDDHLMNITHVIRGEEWLPSTPKHILLYEAFGWKVPQFAHLPLLFNPDKSKLSKRQGDVAVEDYLAKGYLPEVLLNFIALLGWNPGTSQEIFTLRELIKSFSLFQVQRAGAVFDREKLDWMNGYYIRKMKLDKLTRRCIPYLVKSGLIKGVENKKLPPKADPPLAEKIKNKKYILKTQKFRIIKTKEIVNFIYLKKIVALEQERLKRLDEIGELAGFFFIEKLEYRPELLQWKKMSAARIKNNLTETQIILGKIPSRQFQTKKILDSLAGITKKLGTGEVFWPLRTALTGRKASPPPEEVAEILGKKKVLERIEKAIVKLKH